MADRVRPRHTRHGAGVAAPGDHRHPVCLDDRCVVGVVCGSYQPARSTRLAHPGSAATGDPVVCRGARLREYFRSRRPTRVQLRMVVGARGPRVLGCCVRAHPALVPLCVPAGRGPSDLDATQLGGKLATARSPSTSNAAHRCVAAAGDVVVGGGHPRFPVRHQRLRRGQLRAVRHADTQGLRGSTGSRPLHRVLAVTGDDRAGNCRRLVACIASPAEHRRSADAPAAAIPPRSRALVGAGFGQHCDDAGARRPGRRTHLVGRARHAQRGPA